MTLATNFVLKIANLYLSYMSLAVGAAAIVFVSYEGAVVFSVVTERMQRIVTPTPAYNLGWILTIMLWGYITLLGVFGGRYPISIADKSIAYDGGVRDRLQAPKMSMRLGWASTVQFFIGVLGLVLSFIFPRYWPLLVGVGSLLLLLNIAELVLRWITIRMIRRLYYERERRTKDVD